LLAPSQISTSSLANLVVVVDAVRCPDPELETCDVGPGREPVQAPRRYLAWRLSIDESKQTAAVVDGRPDRLLCGPRCRGADCPPHFGAMISPATTLVALCIAMAADLSLWESPDLLVCDRPRGHRRNLLLVVCHRIHVGHARVHVAHLPDVRGVIETL
jgi:hypothetical protein